MIEIKNYGHICGQDHKYESLAAIHGEGNVLIIPEVALNAVSEKTAKATGRPYRTDGKEINTRGNLRRMRMVKSFANVDSAEHRLAVLAGTKGTTRQKTLVTKQLEDFALADTVYESEKARIHSALANLKADELDEVAVFAGHEWGKPSLKVSEKCAELISAEVV